MIANNKTRKVRLGSLKLYEQFQVEGWNAWYEMRGHMTDGWCAVENVMTGRRDTWLGRTMVVAAALPAPGQMSLLPESEAGL